MENDSVSQGKIYKVVERYQSLGVPDGVGHASSKKKLVKPIVCWIQIRPRYQRHVHSSGDDNPRGVSHCGCQLKKDLGVLTSESLTGDWCDKCLTAAKLYLERKETPRS